MKFLTGMWLLVLLGTFGMDLIYENTVPDYTGSDAAELLGTVHAAAFIIVLVLTLFTTIHAFVKED